MLAKDYVTVDKAIQQVADFKKNIEERNLLGEIMPMFDVVKQFRDDYSVPKAEILGKWAKDDIRGFFVAPTYTTESYEAPVDNPLASITRLMNGGVPEKTVTKYRQIIDGVKIKIKGLPFCAVFVEFLPKLQNLKKYSAWIACFLSKTTIQISFCFAEYKEVAWDEYKVASVTDWTSFEAKFAEFNGGCGFLDAFSEKLNMWMRDRIAKSLDIADDVIANDDPANMLPVPSKA